jgi:hypothetical protein
VPVVLLHYPSAALLQKPSCICIPLVCPLPKGSTRICQINALPLPLLLYCCRWGAETFTHLMELVHSPEAVQAGVEPMYCHCLFLAEEPDPFWASTVHGFQRMRGEELDLFSRHVDWPSIQAAAAVAAAAAASSYSPTDSCGPGDGSIDSYTAAESATAFVDGYTFNTVSTCITTSKLSSCRSLVVSIFSTAFVDCYTIYTVSMYLGVHAFWLFRNRRSTHACCLRRLCGHGNAELSTPLTWHGTTSTISTPCCCSSQ